MWRRSIPKFLGKKARRRARLTPLSHSLSLSQIHHGTVSSQSDADAHARSASIAGSIRYSPRVASSIVTSRRVKVLPLPHTCRVNHRLFLFLNESAQSATTPTRRRHTPRTTYEHTRGRKGTTHDRRDGSLSTRFLPRAHARTREPREKKHARAFSRELAAGATSRRFSLETETGTRKRLVRHHTPTHASGKPPSATTGRSQACVDLVNPDSSWSPSLFKGSSSTRPHTPRHGDDLQRNRQRTGTGTGGEARRRAPEIWRESRLLCWAPGGPRLASLSFLRRRAMRRAQYLRYAA